MEGGQKERRDREKKCVLASVSIYILCKDESKWDIDVVLHRLRGHFKFQGRMEQV